MKVGPSIGASGQVRLQYSLIIEDEDLDGSVVTEEDKRVTSKAESWLTSACGSSCPTNCTNQYLDGRGTWDYFNKSVNPIEHDFPVPDDTIKVICKGNTELTLK